MAEQVIRIKASIDFSVFPPDMDGHWVVVRKGTRELLGSGTELPRVLTAANVEQGDQTVVIARVPIRPDL